MATMFRGCDGEGYDDADGRHQYRLLRVGRAVLHHEDDKPLSSLECLAFLTARTTLTHKQAVYVSFAFDYDTTMILRDLPPDVIREIMRSDDDPDDSGRSGRLVEYEGYRIGYRPHKRLHVEDVHTGNTIVIHDTFGFFQTSFVKALTLWDIGTPDERAHIAALKAERSTFTAMTDTEIEYNRQECLLLEQLIGKVASLARSLGYSISPYEGSGNLAQSIMCKHHVPERGDLDLPDDVWKAATAAYYGGRFEISRIGHVGDLHEYDIASAYPDAMRQLPCIRKEHGYWRRHHPNHALIRPYGLARLYKVRYDTANSMWGPLPFRGDRGNICYPSSSTSWIWEPEYRAAVDGGHMLQVLDSYVWIQTCSCPPPYAFVASLYDERRRIGKDGKGLVLKLGLNSLYGKVAQSIGHPKYSNPVYAGLITSITRARMMEVCDRYPDSVVMVATDGIYLTRPLDGSFDVVEKGKPASLGQWEHAIKRDVFVARPGIYWTHDEEGVATLGDIRSRGINRRVLAEYAHDIELGFRRFGTLARVTLGVGRVFHGIRLASHQGTLEQAGDWIDTKRVFAFVGGMPVMKFALRIGRERAKPGQLLYGRNGYPTNMGRYEKRLYNLDGTTYRLQDKSAVESVAYDRSFGGLDREIDVWETPWWDDDVDIEQAFV